MSEYTLIKETDPILSQLASAWDWEQDGEAADLSHAMLKVMFENNGIGLSAPQIGISKRILVMGNPTLSFVCVNPEIVSGQGSTKNQEGCLSFPGLWLHVSRRETVVVKYQDVIGRQHEREFSGLQARVFQHELDHLNGVCFVSRVGKLSLDMAAKRRKKQLKIKD
jgi:peptide deformylase